MKNDKQIEQLLRQALTPSVKPDICLNQKIISSIEENDIMMIKIKRKTPMVAMIAAVVLTLSVTAFAAVMLLNPQQVAEKLEDTSLSKAFTSENAIKINESVTEGDYTISLLGITSGKNLSDFKVVSNETVQTDATYAVVAIAKADGTPMPDTADENYDKERFFVSPLIKGYAPWRYNIMSMNGGYSEFVQDGILYRLISCDNVEIFADKGLYLCVSSSDFYDINAYNYDKATGEITSKDDYKGVNALFKLPIDEKKGNSAKANAYLATLQQ